MDKQKMLERIYEVIADKTLNFWCTVARWEWNSWMYYWYIWGNKITTTWNVIDTLPLEHTVIWHPVMIGDVYQWLFDNKMECNVVYAKNPIRWWKAEPYSSNKEFIFHRRENRRKPIDDQSDECIKFVYDLLPKE